MMLTLKPPSLLGPSIAASAICIVIVDITLPRKTLNTSTPKKSQKNETIFPRPVKAT
jgi:hypothetical protein